MGEQFAFVNQISQNIVYKCKMRIRMREEMGKGGFEQFALSNTRKRISYEMQIVRLSASGKIVGILKS